MYLDPVKTKGNYYIYLRLYDSEITYSKDKRTRVYRFGREDKALEQMYKWRKDFSTFPKELINLGCVRRDLESWIMTLEGRTNKLKLLAT